MSRWRVVLDPRASRTWFFLFSCLMTLPWGGPGMIEARGDLLRMPDGAVVDIGWDYRVADEKVYVRRPEGTLAIPMQSGARIEKTERPKATAVPFPRPADVPREVPAPEATKQESVGEAPAGREQLVEELKGIAQEARELIGELARNPILLAQEKEARLEDITFWLGRTRAAREQFASSESADPRLESTAEDLSSALQDVREALDKEDGKGLLAQDSPLESIQRALE